MVRWCQSMWFCEWKSTLKLAFCIILPFGSRSLYISFWTPIVSEQSCRFSLTADSSCQAIAAGRGSTCSLAVTRGDGIRGETGEPAIDIPRCSKVASYLVQCQAAKSLCQLGGWGIRPARHPVTLIEVASLPQFGVFCKVQFLQLQDIISIAANFWVSFFGLWIYS